MLDFLYGISLLIVVALFAGLESFYFDQNISDYEIKRRAQGGDRFFKKVLWARKNLLNFQFTVRFALLVLLTVFTILVRIRVQSWILLLLADLALIISIRTLSLTRPAASFYQKYIQRSALGSMVSFAKFLKTLLPFLYPKKAPSTSGSKPFYSQEEFLHGLEAGSEMLDPEVAAKLERALHIGDQKVSKIMRPINTLPKIDIASSLTPIVISEMHSRGYPLSLVYDTKEANLVGVLSLSGFEVGNVQGQDLAVRSRTDTDIAYIQEGSSIKELADELISSGKTYCFISSKGGQISGVADIHDVTSWLMAKDLKG